MFAYSTPYVKTELFDSKAFLCDDGVMIFQTEDVLHNGGHAFWPKTSRNASNYVDFVTNTNDIAVKVRPDTRSLEEIAQNPRVSAWFKHDDRVLFIDGSYAFQDAEYLDSGISLFSTSHRDQYPVFTACLAHELSHSLHSNYRRMEVDSKGNPVGSTERELVQLMEEFRCEHRFAEHRPDPAKYIKFLVPRLAIEPILGILANQDKHTDTQLRWMALSGNMLIMGRIFGGTFKEKYVPSNVLRFLCETFDAAETERIHNAMKLVLHIADDDYDGMIALAREILDAAGIDADDDEIDNSAQPPCSNEQDESSEGEQGGGGSSSGDSSDGSEPSEGDSEPGEEDSDSTGDGASDEDGDEADDEDSIFNKNSAGGAGELSDEEIDAQWPDSHSSGDESSEEIAGQIRAIEVVMSNMEQDEREISPYDILAFERDLAMARNSENRQLADILKESGFVGGFNPGNGGGKWDQKMTTRPATAEEQMFAKHLENEIRRAQFRDYTVCPVASKMPPGRFVPREAMRLGIQRSLGKDETATPWTRNKYDEHENPPLTVGIAADISGSMDAFVHYTAGYAWMLSQAVKRNQGKVSSVFWDGFCYRGSTPNLYDAGVVYPKNCDGTSEGLPTAIKTLSGMGGFVGGDGAKVLFILTDSSLSKIHEIRNELREMHNAGVHIVWISTTPLGQNIVGEFGKYVYLKHPSDFGSVVTPEIIGQLETALPRW